MPSTTNPHNHRTIVITQPAAQKPAPGASIILSPAFHYSLIFFLYRNTPPAHQSQPTILPATTSFTQISTQLVVTRHSSTLTPHWPVLKISPSIDHRLTTFTRLNADSQVIPTHFKTHSLNLCRVKHPNNIYKYIHLLAKPPLIFILSGDLATTTAAELLAPPFNSQLHKQPHWPDLRQDTTTANLSFPPPFLSLSAFLSLSILLLQLSLVPTLQTPVSQSPPSS